MSRTVGGWTPAPVGRASLAGELEDDLGVTVGEDGEGYGEDLTEMPLHSQHEVEREATAWATVWQSSAHPPAPAWPALLGQQMPAICVSAAMHACGTFPDGRLCFAS